METAHGWKRPVSWIARASTYILSNRTSISRWKQYSLSIKNVSPWGSWVAQLVKWPTLVSAPVGISRSWDRSPHWAPHSARSLLPILSLLLLHPIKINKWIFKKRKKCRSLNPEFSSCPSFLWGTSSTSVTHPASPLHVVLSYFSLEY